MLFEARVGGDDLPDAVAEALGGGEDLLELHGDPARTAVAIKASATAFFTVERTAFAVFIAIVAIETAFTTIKAAVAAVAVKTTVATIPTERGLVAKGTVFVVVTARAAFRSFTDSEFTVKRDSYGTLRFVFFFTHSFSINCLATDSPSISKIL